MTASSSKRSERGGLGQPLSVTSWLGRDADPQLLRELLREVLDPELGVNIVDLGLVYDVRVDAGVVRVTMTMTSPGCPLGAYLEDAVHAALWGAPGVAEIEVNIVWDPPWWPAMMSAAAMDQLGWRRR